MKEEDGDRQEFIWDSQLLSMVSGENVYRYLGDVLGSMYQVSGVKCNPLTHSHGGITHSHGTMVHTHIHGDEEHTHALPEGATPIDELLTLMKYLVSHNDAHAQEVAELAQELQVAGKDAAYDEIMDAVSDFDMVNAKLAAILEELSVEEFWIK